MIDKTYMKVIKMQHDFPNQYNKWYNRTERKLDIIKPAAVNERYKALIKSGLAKPPEVAKPKTGSKLIDDYNKYVDDLLKLSSHNQNYPVALPTNDRKSTIWE